MLCINSDILELKGMLIMKSHVFTLENPSENVDYTWQARKLQSLFFKSWHSSNKLQWEGKIKGLFFNISCPWTYIWVWWDSYRPDWVNLALLSGRGRLGEPGRSCVGGHPSTISAELLGCGLTSQRCRGLRTRALKRDCLGSHPDLLGPQFLFSSYADKHVPLRLVFPPWVMGEEPRSVLCTGLNHRCVSIHDYKVP